MSRTLTVPKAGNSRSPSESSSGLEAPRGKISDQRFVRRSWGSTLRRVLRSLLLLLFFALLAAGAYGSLEIQRQLEQDPRFQLANWQISPGAFPPWATPQMQCEIRSALENNGLIGAGAPGGHIFAASFLAQVRKRFAEMPWIRGVGRLELNYPGIHSLNGQGGGELFIELQLRRPIAAVQWGEEYLLLDAEGVRIGEALRAFQVQGLKEIPLLVGAERFVHSEIPRLGHKWVCPEILEGLEVAWILHSRRIHQRYPSHPIREIRLHNLDGKNPAFPPGVLIKVDGLPPLAWGRSPLANAARTSSVDEVMQKLQAVLATPEVVLGDAAAETALLRLDMPGPIIRVKRG